MAEKQKCDAKGCKNTAEKGETFQGQTRSGSFGYRLCSTCVMQRKMYRGMMQRDENYRSNLGRTFKWFEIRASKQRRKVA